MTTINNWKDEWGVPRDNKVPHQVQTPQKIKTGNLPQKPRSPTGGMIADVTDRDQLKSTLELRQRIKDAERARRRKLKEENRLIRTIR